MVDDKLTGQDTRHQLKEERGEDVKRRLVIA